MSLSELTSMPLALQRERGLVYTPREIAQQPETWTETLEIFIRHQEALCGFLEQAGVRNSLEQRPAVLLIGAGTSDYIGGALELLLRERWGCEVRAYASTELLPNIDSYVIPGKKYLWISFSRSGDSPEGLAVVQEALSRYPEIYQLVITCNSNARMAAACKEYPKTAVVVLDDTVNDRSLAMTSSFTNMVVMGQCLAHAWSIGEYRPILDKLVPAGSQLLVNGYRVATEISRTVPSRVCFVGSGPLASVAQESALKVLELSAGRVQAMFETTLGLRHGPMAALDQNTLFIALLSSDRRRQGYAQDLIRELKSKQVVGSCMAVGPAQARAAFAPVTDTYLAINAEIEDGYSSILYVLFGQLLGLVFSIRCGLKPDAPSPAGVINRVVQEFAIYR